MVLAAGGLLVIALVAFLAYARWKTRFILREIPQRLGANIQQEANGVTYTQAHGGHTLFKIHASKVVQLKQGGHAILHDVLIELYGEDGSRVDRISGDEFEYDQKDGIAKAAGPVEITLMRPGERPAMAPKPIPGHPPRTAPLTSAAQKASQGEIHVKTSGLTFDQKSGIATTAEQVEFAIAQGNGRSMGATFDSENGRLVLDHAIELQVNRGPEHVVLRAHHAEFERDTLLCRMQGAQGDFRGGQALAGKADLLFRPDGSASRLDASDGFSVTTATSARIAAPLGTLVFDQHNQPRQGRLEGGATIDSVRGGRHVHGSAPVADLTFTSQGLLSHAHLERGVLMHSDQVTATGRTSRDWRSPVADAEFRNAGKGQVELASVNGAGGVVITSQAQRADGPVLPSRLAADRVTAAFSDGQVLTRAVGTGHASMEETTASGAIQTTTGDRIDASFAPPPVPGANPQPNAITPGGQLIQSATIEGNVVLTQQPAPREQPSARSNPEPAAKLAAPAEPLRATAGRAVYEGAGEWLHLLIHPRVETASLQLSADKVDVSQSSGDAFARGNVKATWFGSAARPAPSATPNSAPLPGTALGGQGTAHVIAAEAQLHQATGQATFRGQVRLWQQANSISAPLIELDKTRQTLVAHAAGANDPVRVVMLSAGGVAADRNAPPGLSASTKNAGSAAQGSDRAPASPSVIRVRGGDLKYSEAERKAVIHGAPAGTVVAETGSASIVSNDLEMLLLPPGNHAAPDGGAAQVDRVTATGQVAVHSQGRRGAGERLVYSSETGQYVLTGTPASPPTLSDPARVTVSGASLIFNSRDDSVSIEGAGGQKTLTETVAPK